MGECLTRHHPSEDRISLLPNEILISTLSPLPFKEAARTSVLSTRWIHVWKYIPSLDFDASAALYKMTTESSTSGEPGGPFFILLERERRYYVEWVNKVLQSHKAPTLDEFRVYCDLGSSYEKKIDKWLQYAFARNVQRLELNLTTYAVSLNTADIYNFSRKSLGLRSLHSLERSSLVDFKSLKMLSLKKVNVSEKVLQFFLRNCKILENLVVHGSDHLKKLEISGPALALRHLELCFCRCLKSLIVCNVKLVSLKITYPGELVLKDVPMLVDFCLCGYRYILKGLINQLSNCISKLEVLSLRLEVPQFKEIAELPQLTALKQLILVVDVSKDESMLGLTDFIRATPSLTKFVLKLCRYGEFVRSKRQLGSAAKYPHQNLKVVEVNGGHVGACELELVKYFLENAPSLEELIVNTRRQWTIGRPWYLDRPITEEDEVRRRYVKAKLQRLLPSQIRLTVL